VPQFSLNLLRFFLHADPPQFADELDDLAGRAPMISFDRNSSTLQIGVHEIPPFIEVTNSSGQISLLPALLALFLRANSYPLAAGQLLERRRALVSMNF
jgi:hypothetical protein